MEPEPEPEAEPGSISEEFLQTLVKSLKSEITASSVGLPRAYETGTFWHRARDPIFALNAARTSISGMNPRELYFLDVFLWLPCLKTGLPGEPESLHCIQANCMGRLVRRVKGLHRDYSLLTNRRECNIRTCGKSYQGTDPGTVSQMSRALQESFPGMADRAQCLLDANIIQLLSPPEQPLTNRFYPS